MSALQKIAFFQNRRDEVPNQELARQLAAENDAAGINEIAANLWNQNKNISSDCLKVMYEIGYLKPELIAPYASDFIKLIQDRDNRKVWGGMIALATIAALNAKDIGNYIDVVLASFEAGSVITKVWGVRVLSHILARDPSLETKILPVLLDNLKTCLPRDIPTHLESMQPMLNADSQPQIQKIMDSRIHEMTDSQRKRLQKVMRRIL